MKTINVNMTAELTGSDILQALVNGGDPKKLLEDVLETPGVLSTFLERHRAEVTKAVSNFMSTTHAMRADKIIYQNGKVIVEAHTEGQTLPIVEEPSRTRVAPEGHRKPNVGVFQFLREYFADEKKSKNRELSFDDVLKDTQFFYPKVSKRLLQIYLHDKRQLKGVNYEAKRGTVIIK